MKAFRVLLVALVFFSVVGTVNAQTQLDDFIVWATTTGNEIFGAHFLTDYDYSCEELVTAKVKPSLTSIIDIAVTRDGNVFVVEHTANDDCKIFGLESEDYLEQRGRGWRINMESLYTIDDCRDMKIAVNSYISGQTQEYTEDLAIAYVEDGSTDKPVNLLVARNMDFGDIVDLGLTLPTSFGNGGTIAVEAKNSTVYFGKGYWRLGGLRGFNVWAFAQPYTAVKNYEGLDSVYDYLNTIYVKEGDGIYVGLKDDGADTQHTVWYHDFSLHVGSWFGKGDGIIKHKINGFADFGNEIVAATESSIKLVLFEAGTWRELLSDRFSIGEPKSILDHVVFGKENKLRILKPDKATEICSVPTGGRYIKELSVAGLTDDDGDGYYLDSITAEILEREIDCDDSDEEVNPGTDETPARGNCSDGFDNDCDGKTDDEDEGCNVEIACRDGVDNDIDGFIDENDDDCLPLLKSVTVDPNSFFANGVADVTAEIYIELGFTGPAPAILLEATIKKATIPGSGSIPNNVIPECTLAGAPSRNEKYSCVFSIGGQGSGADVIHNFEAGGAGKYVIQVSLKKPKCEESYHCTAETAFKIKEEAGEELSIKSLSIEPVIVYIGKESDAEITIGLDNLDVSADVLLSIKDLEDELIARGEVTCVAAACEVLLSELRPPEATPTSSNIFTETGTYKLIAEIDDPCGICTKTEWFTVDNKPQVVNVPDIPAWMGLAVGLAVLVVVVLDSRKRRKTGK